MSGPVVPFAEQSNFPQQGSLDWVALSKALFTCSVDVMSRMSKAGVEMITIAMGRFICSGFILKADAQKRLFDALANLKSFASYGKVIWFGFGVKHVVKDLCETEQGAACVALCACLAISYDSFFAAEVLKELCKVRGTPSDLTPSIHQWNSLVSVCAGTISTSQFPILIEGFARLTSTNLVRREPTSPEALAKVLGALADVSNGKLTNITITGGPDCSWLAAVSQWLLSLHIEIHLHSGECIYQSPGSQTGCLPQVTIVFDLDSQVKSQLSLANRFYVVPSGRELWKVGFQEQSFVAGRSNWTTILRDSFGSSIDTLTRGATGQHFAMLLLYASKEANRQYRNKFVPNLIDLYSLPEPFHFGYEACRGRAFLSFAARRLPELSSLIEGIIDKGCEPYTTSNWIECSNRIESACTCIGNSGLGYEDDYTKLCLITVAETIVAFTWILSALKVDDSLLPSSNSLLDLYYRQHQHHSSKAIKEIAPPLPILSLALKIFSTSGPDWPSGDLLAIAKNGVCVYFRALEDLDLPPSEVSTVLVVPGYIECERAIYKTLYDLAPAYTSRQTPGPLGFDLSCALIAKETPRENSLAAAYRMSNSTGDREWWLGITMLQSSIARLIRGSKTCPGRLCYEWKPQQLTEDCETGKYILEVCGPGAKPASVRAGKRWTLGSRSLFSNSLIALKREYHGLYAQLTIGVGSQCLIELGDCPGCAIRSICRPESRPHGNIRASARAFTVSISGTMEFVTLEGGPPSTETLTYSLRTSSEPALYEASREGDLGQVRLLLQEGVDVNPRTAGGTALQAASASGHEPVVQLLIENGAYALPSQGTAIEQ